MVGFVDSLRVRTYVSNKLLTKNLKMCVEHQMTTNKKVDMMEKYLIELMRDMKELKETITDFTKHSASQKSNESNISKLNNVCDIGKCFVLYFASKQFIYCFLKPLSQFDINTILIEPVRRQLYPRKLQWDTKSISISNDSSIDSASTNPDWLPLKAKLEKCNMEKFFFYWFEHQAELSWERIKSDKEQFNKMEIGKHKYFMCRAKKLIKNIMIYANEKAFLVRLRIAHKILNYWLRGKEILIIRPHYYMV